MIGSKIEHTRHYFFNPALVADACGEAGLSFRSYDAYIHAPMQNIVADRLRAEGSRDPLGVEQVRARLETAYAIADAQVCDGPWTMGTKFTLADCAATPALYYGNKVASFEGRWRNLTAYLERLKRRPSVARVLAEGEPYFHSFPG